MTRTSGPLAQPAPRRRPWIPLVAAVAIALAFAAGRMSGGSGPERGGTLVTGGPAAVGASEPVRADATLASVRTAAPAVAPPVPLAAASAAVAPPTGRRTPAPPEVVALVREDALAQLEALRPHIVSSCWPAAERSRARTRLTYHLTFGPDGREIARGLQDDRSAPAGAFARCLRRLRDVSLTAPRTGTYVTLKLPVSYP